MSKKIETLQRLIDTCETVAEGHVGLDTAIDAAVNDPDRCRPWTTSIDAALQLLPPGADWRRLTHRSMSVYAANPYNAQAQKRIDGMGATPALQMCAAALRLRLEPLLKAQAIEARRAAHA